MSDLFIVIGIIVYFIIGSFIGGFLSEKLKDCDAICILFWPIVLVALIVIFPGVRAYDLGQKLDKWIESKKKK